MPGGLRFYLWEKEEGGRDNDQVVDDIIRFLSKGSRSDACETSVLSTTIVSSSRHSML